VDDLELLRRFEPILRFNRVELFLPSDAEAYVRACSLWMRSDSGDDIKLVPAGQLDLERLATIARDHRCDTLHLLYVEHPLSRREFREWRRAGHGEQMRGGSRFSQVGITSRIFDALFRLTLLFRGRVPRGSVAAAEITYREQIADAGTPYYGRVSREAGWTILQYWFFYPMNDWRSSFHGINDHEADWENIILFLAPSAQGELEPRWVAFSSHDAEGDGLRRRADDPALEWHDGHIVAYPGAGSHSHSPRATDEAVRVDPPVMRGFVNVLRKVFRTITPWTEHSGLEEGLGVPFVDYHRGDGVSIGPGADRAWQPVQIDDDTPWVRDYSGRWGRDSRDPFGGESAPTGPKHERDGIDRMRWEDPLGWAGMQKIDPHPGAEEAALADRRRAVDARIREIDEQVDIERTAARREAAELRALDADAITAEIAQKRRAVLQEHDATMLVLRDERRHLTAERDALDAAERDGLPLESPRAHLGRAAVDALDAGGGSEEEPRVRSRVLRIWAAISTPLIIAIVVWLLVGHDSGYYWFGALVGVLVVVGLESLARGRLLAFIGWAIVVIAGAMIIIGLAQEWRLTLGVLLAVGAIVLLAQNLRELRSSR
jgi:hypothetical protein